MRQKTGKVAAAIVSGCALYIFLLYLLQNCFIIFPDSSYISPQQAGIPRFQEKPFTADDGTKIMCWYAKGNPDKPAILFFHGNAGQIATFSLQMAAYLRKGYSVMMPEYRGFASTPGEFSQENIYRDGAAAYDFLHRQLGHSDIIIFGYSMGAAAAAAGSAAAGTGAGSGGTVLFAEKNRQRKTGARCSFNIEKRTAVLPFCQYVQEAAVYCPRCRRQAYPAQPRQSFIWPEPKQRPRIENSGRAKP